MALVAVRLGRFALERASYFAFHRVIIELLKVNKKLERWAREFDRVELNDKSYRDEFAKQWPDTFQPNNPR